MNFKKTLTFFFALIAFGMTVSFLIHLYEYIKVGILNNIDDYPFGVEDPNVGGPIYKDAAIYTIAMLHFTITSFISAFLLWLGIFKKKILLILIGIAILVLDMVFSYLIY